MAWLKGSDRVCECMTSRGLSPRAAEGARRSTRPVYEAGTGKEPVTLGCGGGTTAARGRSTGAPWPQPRFVTTTGVFGRSHGLPTHWSGRLCRPGLRRGPQPRAAFGGQARSLVAPMCRPRPRTWVGAGPPRRGRARRTLMPSHTATGSLATVPGVSVVFAAIRCVRWLMDLHTHTFGVDLGPAWGFKRLQSDPKSSPSDILKLQLN